MTKRKYWFCDARLASRSRCIRHHAVEEEQGCRSADRLGPHDRAGMP
jgi:hypothetical protein